jgi:hypothetical protein
VVTAIHPDARLDLCAAPLKAGYAVAVVKASTWAPDCLSAASLILAASVFAHRAHARQVRSHRPPRKIASRMKVADEPMACAFSLGREEIARFATLRVRRPGSAVRHFSSEGSGVFDAHLRDAEAVCGE